MATAASGGWAWMTEVAGEELAKLEAAHPGRFGPLKAELRRLVAEPSLDAAVFPPLDQCLEAALLPRAGDAPLTQQAAPPPPLLCTQGSFVRSSSTRLLSSSAPPLVPSRAHSLSIASPCEVLLEHSFAESSTEKRKPAGGACERKDGRRRKRAATAPPPGGTKDRAEMAIERAERCLERIRDVKRELARLWDPFIVIEKKGVDKVQ
jgi:hypothetical protein